jgi:hypothetical protein
MFPVKQFTQGENACCQSLASLQDSCVCESLAPVLEKTLAYILYLTSRPVLLSTGQICYLCPVNTTARKGFFGILLPAQDRHFIVSTAKTLGISQGEFIRRLINDSKLRYLETGLYQLPDPSLSLPNGYVQDTKRGQQKRINELRSAHPGHPRFRNGEAQYIQPDTNPARRLPADGQ